MAGCFRALVFAGLCTFAASEAAAAPRGDMASSLDAALRFPEVVQTADCAPASVVTASASRPTAAVELASASEACSLASDDCGAGCGCDCHGCGDCCDCGVDCGDGCCTCGPTWIISAGAVILDRSRPNSGRIVSTTNQFNVISSGSDYDFDFAGGPEVSIARRTARGNLWEVRYFGVPEWDETVDYGAVGIFQLGAFNASAPDNLTGRYTSSVHSTEINWHHPLTARFTPLVGFRWIELTDTLEYAATYPGTVVVWNWNENNHLYGGQIGGTFDLGRIAGPVTLTSAIKAGVYGNSADNDFTLSDASGPLFDDGAAESDVAFVGEINIRAGVPITRHVSLYGGYQLLWIDGVALASDEAATATVTLIDDTITTSRDLFYHGATTGVEFAW